MNFPSLRSRIRNGILLLLALVVTLGIYTLPRIYRLGGAIRETLYRNYISIEAGQHMHEVLRNLELAERDGRARTVLPQSHADFAHWMDVERHDFTERGEPQLAADIDRRATRLFDDIAGSPANSRHDQEFDVLHRRIDDLIEMNKAAMFRADSRAVGLGANLSYEFAAGLFALLIVGAALSWWLGWALRPLTELVDRLRGVSQRKIHMRLGPQKLAELDAVAREFNQMAERLEQYDAMLEQYDAMNVERLVYEKSKTEAIIESLEDGVVLIDSGGIVAHINEVAAIILGIEQSDALGSQFDDLNSNHPHYLRVRDALRNLAKAEHDEFRVEIQLHVRGRDHSYVLKPVPLRRGEGRAFGTLLILQDVTYLRDQDRARTNLVATLSHELRTPLTSLTLSAELLQRDRAALNAKDRELVQAVMEESSRMKQLADNLLNLARGEVSSIALQKTNLDMAKIAAEVSRRFALQAENGRIKLESRIERVPTVRGDPVKLSWVLSNLIGNALRYTPSGSSVEVLIRPSGSAMVRLEVADSGPGIAPELRSFIFERFAQYSANGDDKGSAGLGLAIVKDIVEAHGGRIFVEANDPQGSRFIVEIPSTGETQ